MSVLTVEAVCELLALSRRGFYRHRQTLERAGVLVEALPRVGRRSRYLAQPVQDYVTGRTRAAVVRAQMRRTA